MTPRRKGAGRPKRPGEWDKITVRIPRALAEWVRARGKPQGDTVTEALEALKEQEEAK